MTVRLRNVSGERIVFSGLNVEIAPGEEADVALGSDQPVPAGLELVAEKAAPKKEPQPETPAAKE